MKRGTAWTLLFILPFILSSLFAFIFLTNFALAYDGYDYSYGDLSLAELAQNEWVNVALVFLLIFAVCWFVMQQVFRSSPGAAFVISFVLGVMGALGVLSMFGPIIPKVGWWVIALAIALLIAILWFQFKRRGSSFWIILLGIALVWLLWARNELCPYILPHVFCVVLDAISIAILIVAILMFLIWLLKKLKGGGGGQWQPTVKPPREKRVLRISVHGNGTTNPAPKDHLYNLNQKVRVKAIAKKGSRFERWLLDGHGAGATGDPTVDVIMDDNHHLIAVFGGAKGPPPTQPRPLEPISVTIEASPNRVSRVTPFVLRWTSKNADWVEIEPKIGRVDRVGSKKIVHLDKTTTFTAIARNKQGQVATASCRVDVMEALPPPKQKEEMERKERTAAELQQKWDYYRELYEQEWNNYQARAKRENLRPGIPPRDTPEGHKCHNYYKAMKIIENMAKKQKIQLRLTKLK
ncbi:MAG: hypothetical protein K6T16_01410 [Candidatus Pacearchaeota archaeon]|nr:hypothetical protein [Candidatus Pacearchaeota archaeon]